MSKNKIISDVLLLIGAGNAQIEGINTAKNLGFKVIAIDGDPNAPGLKKADVGIVSDVRDYKNAVKIAKKYNITATTTISSEVCLPTVAAINEICGLPGILPEKTSLVTNKGEMRIKYKKYNVPSPQFYVINDRSELKEAAQQINYPSVIKPVDSSGSKGVALVQCFSQLENAYSSARSFSNLGKVILEEFMDGEEVSVEAFVVNGNINILTLSDKLRTSPPYLLDTCVIFPSKYPENLQNEIKSVACSAIRALELDNCPIHVELLLTDGGPKIVELAARGAGFQVYTHMIPHVTGVSPVEVQLRLLRGEEPEIKVHNPLKGACIRFWEGKNGFVKSISGEDTAKKLQGVMDLQIYASVGSKVNNLKSGVDRLGHLITYGDTSDEAVQIADHVFNIVNIVIDK
jgi:biotin carboxylase